MALTKKRKKEIISNLEEKLKKQESIIFVDFSRLDSEQIFDLRERLKESNCLFKVVKKSLFKIALERAGVSVWNKIKDISGQLALIFGFEEENRSPKISYQFSKQNKDLEILGGLLDDEFKTSEQVITLAQLPTRKELLGTLANTISAPTFNFTKVLKGNLQKLIFVLNQIKK